MMTDRIELKSNCRLANILKYSGIMLIVISLIKIAFTNHSNFRGLSEYVDAVLLFLGGSFALYNSQSKKLKIRLEQFIEWNDKKVIYKLTEQEEPQEVEFELIENVSISVDKIILTTKNNSVQTLDISDFKNYDDRKKIKLKFETLELN